jgi:soluble lytic murein transglycosylase-like protein
VIERAAKSFGLAPNQELETLAGHIYRLKRSAAALATSKPAAASADSLILLRTANLPPLLYRVAATLYFSGEVLSDQQKTDDKSAAVLRAQQRVMTTQAWPLIASTFGRADTPSQAIAQLAPSRLFLSLGIARPKIPLGTPPAAKIAKPKKEGPQPFASMRALLTTGKLWEAYDAAQSYAAPRTALLCDSEYALAEYIRGQAFRATQKRSDALKAYLGFVATAGSDNCRSSKFGLTSTEFVALLSDGQTWAARLHWEQGDNRSAETLVREVLAQATEESHRATAFEALQVLVGRIGFEDYPPSDNLALIRSFSDRFVPTQEQKEWLALRTALFAIETGAYDEAQSFLAPLLSSTDKSTKAAGKFWMGRIFSLKKSDEEARTSLMEAGQTDPLGYYDVRAGIELQTPSLHTSQLEERFFPRDVGDALRENVRIESNTANQLLQQLSPTTTLSQERDLFAALFAVALHRSERESLSAEAWQTEWWRSFGIEKMMLAWLRDIPAQTDNTTNNQATPTRRLTLLSAYAAYLAGDFSKSILTAARARDLGAPETMSEAEREATHLLLYQRPHEQAFHDAAQRCGVEVNLLFAVARQESMFRTDAKSPVGALGLMQLMPATGRRLFTKLQIDSTNVERSLLVPEKNTLAGACYLAELLERYSGNRALAVAAYNAGETAVDGWRTKRFKQGDEPLFIEFIPFQETQKYVQRVLRNYANMNWIYGSTPTPANGKS